MTHQTKCDDKKSLCSRPCKFNDHFCCPKFGKFVLFNFACLAPQFVPQVVPHEFTVTHLPTQHSAHFLQVQNQYVLPPPEHMNSSARQQESTIILPQLTVNRTKKQNGIVTDEFKDSQCQNSTEPQIQKTWNRKLWSRKFCTA
jgi:hypothetical protein